MGAMVSVRRRRSDIRDADSHPHANAHEGDRGYSDAHAHADVYSTDGDDPSAKRNSDASRAIVVRDLHIHDRMGCGSGGEAVPIQ